MLFPYGYLPMESKEKMGHLVRNPVRSQANLDRIYPAAIYMMLFPLGYNPEMKYNPFLSSILLISCRGCSQHLLVAIPYAHSWAEDR